MRLRTARVAAAGSSASPDDAVVTAVDAALGFVAGQRWVQGHDTATVLESVRDVALEINAPEHVRTLIESALAGCDRGRIPAGQLTDGLLDIRNAIRNRESP